MVRLFLPAAGVIVLALGTLIRAQAPNQTYKTPPGDLGTILDAPMVPTIEVAPGGRTVLLAYRPTLPPVAELSEPWIGLAGIRINPRNNGLRVTSRTNRLALVDVATGQERKIGLPAQGTFIPAFSPDGRKLAVTHTTDSSIGLLAVDVATGAVTTLVKSGINGAAGECAWRADSSGLLCYLIPEGRGPAPVRPSIPAGPTAKENSDLTSNWIYRDLLTDAHDERLFDHFLTSQLAWVDLSGKVSAVGKPAVFEPMTFRPAAQSADDRHLIVTILTKPYQYELQSTAFPRDIELWDAGGRLIRKLAHQTTTSHRSAEEGAAIVGPRQFQWHATNPHQLTWVEALDEGDPATPAPHRDRLMQLESPFTGTASETLRTEWRLNGHYYTDAGHQLTGERDPQQAISRYWLTDATGKRKVWEIRGRNRMGTPFYNPGTHTILQHGEHIYFEAEVDSATGLRPVLTKFNLRTLESMPLWESSADAAELPLAILDTTGRKLLVQRQTARTPPNIVAFDGDTGERRPVTKIVDPQPKVSGIQKRLLTYKRKDGVPLWGTLYLPPDYQPGQRLPTILWTYPREFRSSDAAAEVTTTTNYFTRVVPGHPLLYALHGYAVLFQPTIPIIGERDTANDTYIEQLVAGAQAAVDHVVEIGVADRDRIGIGGHSYGAFTAANLLAHTDLFRAGVARSGDYNLTLQPMGFQNERRSLWQRPELYTRMSPLWHADKINEPILLIHGAADENPGTPVLQSDLFYMSLRSLKSNVRYVTLPHEGHNYTARESHLHVIAETLEWFDKHLKRSSSPVSSK